MKASSRADSEELILYVLIGVIGMIPVIAVIARGGVFGSESTIGLLMLFVALGGLLTTWWIARKHHLRR